MLRIEAGISTSHATSRSNPSPRSTWETEVASSTRISLLFVDRKGAEKGKKAVSDRVVKTPTATKTGHKLMCRAFCTASNPRISVAVAQPFPLLLSPTVHNAVPTSTGRAASSTGDTGTLCLRRETRSSGHPKRYERVSRPREEWNKDGSTAKGEAEEDCVHVHIVCIHPHTAHARERQRTEALWPSCLSAETTGSNSKGPTKES
mmetsp:Transcript_29726/g.58349  ORF Transcript_29726/g.58349 Transcript_29726/m.58349 type:complete len:205 (-) Transcript_29726:1562-2176(-)